MDFAEFTNEQSDIARAKFDIESSAVSSLWGVPLAAVVDTGISIWNSVVPESYEYDTRDVLAGINENVADIYSANEDTVKFLSFIGGIAVPGGVATKGMNLLLAGAKGVNWFSTAGQTQRLAGIKAAYENSGKASTLYRSLLWENRFATAGNALVDAAVFEGMFYATSNAHPYMEDYVKDPIKNAGMGIALGFGLIGTAGLIGQRFAVKGVQKEVARDAYGELLKDYTSINTTENLSGQLSAHAANVENWTNLLATKPSLNEYTRSLIDFNIRASSAATFEIIEKMTGKSLGKLGENQQAFKEHLSKLIASDPVAFAGIDAARLANVSELASLHHIKKDPFLLDTGNIPFTRQNAKGQIRGTTLAYSSEFGAFMRPEDLKHYGVAADMGIYTLEGLQKSLPKGWHLHPNKDFGIEAMAMSTPAIDLQYLKGLAYFDDLDLTQAVHIDSLDLPALQGFISSVRANGISPSALKLFIDGKAARLDEAMAYLLEIKKTQALGMVQAGIPELVVAKRLNVEPGFVTAIAQKAPDYVVNNLDYMIHSDVSQIQSVLAPTNASLLFRTNTNKISAAKIRSGLGAVMGRDAEDLVKEGLFAASKSRFIREWFGSLGGDNFRAMRDMIRSKLSITGNEFMGTRFFTSADHALRSMEEIGPIATQLGKDGNEIHLRAVEKFFSPVRDELLALARDKTALTEFNILDHLNAKLKGPRKYEDGSIWHVDPDMPKITKFDPVSGKDIEVPNWIRAQWQGEDFVAQSDTVKNIYEWMANSGRELYNQAETLRSIPGIGMFKDLGFWMPSANLKDKYIAYVINLSDQTTTLLYAKSAEGLQDVIRTYKTQPGVNIGVTHNIVERGTDQKLYNILQGRHDPMFMASADIGMLHSGASASATVGASTERLVDVINAYEHQLNYNIKSMMELQLSDVFEHLHQTSSYLQSSVFGQPAASGIFKKREKDSASVLMRTILGKSTVDESYLWRGTNQIYGALLEKALGTISDVMAPILNAGKGIFKKSPTTADYKAYMDELASRGVPNPYEVFTKYEDQLRMYAKDVGAITEPLAPRITVLMNTMAATTLLKVGELGQAYVNAISLPILMTSEISSKLPSQFMNAHLTGRPELGVVKTIFEGWRYKGLPNDKAVQKAKDLGLFRSVTSEADDLFRLARSVDPGVLSRTEDLLRSRTVEMLSAASTWSESFVREKAFMTGLHIARSNYTGLTDDAAVIFARDFMERVIGNYSAAQRPTMFQGTFGVAMGLFQTYMVTMAQSMFRHLEKGEFKALAKTMLAQSGIFGAKSLPGFNMVSAMIGDHFSDDNVDPITGTFRALNDTVAQGIIYGIPSNLPPAISIRGELQPRIPDPTAGINAIPAVNLTSQVYEAMRHVAKSIFSVDKTAGQGIMEALSMQSLSRPVARLSELTTGYSVTRKGNVVATPEEVWTWNSAVARVFSTRPIQEVRARDAIHLNTLYGSMDREDRQEVTQQLKTHLRAGTLNHEIVASLAEKYLRTGTPTGWNSAVNTALAQTALPINTTIRNYLAPNSPTITLIDNMH